MRFDYLEAFPLPAQLMSQTLLDLFTPVGMSSSQFVKVASIENSNEDSEQTERLHLIMAVVPGTENGPIDVLPEAGRGVVEYSVPIGETCGCSSDFVPSVSGYDYIVAAWGDGSFYSFNLAEKVWMTLGLTPRCLGNEQQRIVYDDLGLPELGVAEGEISSEYYWSLKRVVKWSMSNEYLRRYLWLRGARGVRVFYYSVQLADIPEVRKIMNGDSHVVRKPENGVSWYELDLREHRGGILLQLWASIEAVTSELCLAQDADGIEWPGFVGPMTRDRANALMGGELVHLDDRFLEKYEQDSFYDSTPTQIGGQWYCSPSYRGEWAFTDCRRVGRNLIQVPMRELYKPKPDRAIVHARSFAVDPENLKQVDRSEEHVVSKVQRLLDVFLRLGDGLSGLGAILDLNKSAIELTSFDRDEVRANGWLYYPALSRLAQVAPLNMTQQQFLARCKSMHELLQSISAGYLKSLLGKAGCPRAETKSLANLKLLEAILNIVETLNVHEEKTDAFISDKEPEGWNARNDSMAFLFLNNDLRIADAHDTFSDCLTTLQDLGFDTANVNSGYGLALDYVMDGVINTIDNLASALERLLDRR